MYEVNFDYVYSCCDGIVFYTGDVRGDQYECASLTEWCHPQFWLLTILFVFLTAAAALDLAAGTKEGVECV